ncbi:MAG TPA: hypothetical protein VFK14_00045 [Solirubrobacterales bacterium]|nr:hypothetical protein [Solirubrobacterales bacterium]
MSKKVWIGRIYLGRDSDGKQRFHWVGRYPTRKERNAAVSKELGRLEEDGCSCKNCVATGRFQAGGGSDLPTCDAYVETYLADYKRRNRGSSHDTQTQRLSRFKRDFAGKSVDQSRQDLRDWRYGEGKWKGRGPVPNGDAEAIVSLYNHAINEDDLALPKSPARGLSQKSKGRSEDPPPTRQEFERILDACSVLGAYAPTMRAIVLFATFELMRPSEVCALAPGDVDFRRMRVRKASRVYRGTVDAPKTGPKTIALTPPGRDAIVGLPLDGPRVFTSKTGKPLSTNALYEYWRLVRAAASVSFDFYHATKHYGVWFMWVELGMSDRAIAAQAGWKLKTVTEMLETYGHGDVGALEEVDAAFAQGGKRPVPLRSIAGGGTQS